MRHRLIVCSALSLFAGCSPSAPTLKVVERASPAATSIDVAISDLFTRYQQLPEEAKHSLQGDKLIVQIEAALPHVSPALRGQVAGTVEDHNARLLQRALNDPNLDPEAVRFEAPETAPVPRERP
jgi:hypothetical protein